MAAIQDRHSEATRFPRLTMPSRPAILAAVGIAIVAMLAYLAAGALTVFVVGLILAVILDPLVTRLVARGLPRSLAAGAVVAGISILVVGTGVMVCLAVAGEAGRFVAAGPAWIDQVATSYRQAPIPTQLRFVTDMLIANGAHGLADVDLTGAAIDLTSNVVGVVAVVFGLLPFFVFFVLSDRPRTVHHVVGAIPSRWRKDIVTVGQIGLDSLATYLRGEAILIAALSILTWLGLQLVAVGVDARIGDFALLLTLVAGFGELIPMLGPWIGAAPAVAFGLTLSPEVALAVAAVYLVIAIVEGQILVPLVHGRRFAIHPAVILVALVIGSALAGLIGTILTLPVLAAGYETSKYLFRRSTGETPESAARKRTSAVGMDADAPEPLTVERPHRRRHDQMARPARGIGRPDAAAS